MSVNAQDFLEEGIRIRSSASNEVSLRSAASRYYYGLFHLAKSFSDANGAGVDNYYGGTHAKLSDYFQSGSLPDGVKRLQFRKIAILLRQNHSERCRADYRLDEVYTAENLDCHILNCDACIKEIEAIAGTDVAVGSGP